MTRPGAPADVEESHGRFGGGTTPPRSCVAFDAACLRPLTDDVPYEYRDEVESAEDDLDFAFPLNDEESNDDDADASPRDVGKVEDMCGPVVPHVEDEEDTDASLSLVGLFIEENVAVLSLPYLTFAYGPTRALERPPPV